MRFYVAGPMRGYTEFNFPAFARATRMLRARGHEVISPAENDLSSGFDPTRGVAEQDFDVRNALRWDIEQILTCDAVYMLNGWEGSTGASIEHSVAHGIGLQIQYESPKDRERFYYRAHTAFTK